GHGPDNTGIARKTSLRSDARPELRGRCDAKKATTSKQLAGSCDCKPIGKSGGRSPLDHGHAKVPRASCTPAIAMPPSPTAAAQRFTEPERTSPAAKIPGRLVSTGPGARTPTFHADAWATAGPVLIKPFSSRSIWGGSQSV